MAGAGPDLNNSDLPGLDQQWGIAVTCELLPERSQVRSKGHNSEGLEANSRMAVLAGVRSREGCERKLGSYALFQKSSRRA